LSSTLLAKVSQAELDRLQQSIAGAAEHVSVPENLNAVIYRERMQSYLLEGMRRAQLQGLGRTRLRQAVTDLVYEAQTHFLPDTMFLAYQVDWQTKFQGLFAQYEQDRVDFGQLRSAARHMLAQGYRTSFQLGKTFPGTQQLPDLTAADTGRISIELNAEYGFLDGLLEEARRRHEVTDTPFGLYIANRARLYAEALRSLFYYGQLAQHASTDPVWWVLVELADHCSVCPELAAGSPYTVATLPTVPSRGDTPCLGNCKCFLDFDSKE
jgi:hypothetical protein